MPPSDSTPSGTASGTASGTVGNGDAHSLSLTNYSPSEIDGFLWTGTIHQSTRTLTSMDTCRGWQVMSNCNSWLELVSCSNCWAADVDVGLSWWGLFHWSCYAAAGSVVSEGYGPIVFVHLETNQRNFTPNKLLLRMAHIPALIARSEGG
ncbi:hypothetical protein E6O75_ATG08151 [Venturia nashicola]|uniref:Uncharacterized protein n=1 Tax=Venturia nashicola TaxID=86259 RepID=A0A4Z1P080_9PEZI|nr:hypothetical protein E6O75_ATG08151 [Venturia nashicola]